MFTYLLFSLVSSTSLRLRKLTKTCTIIFKFFTLVKRLNHSVSVISLICKVDLTTMLMRSLNCWV